MTTERVTRRNERGFTLVEVLFAMVILAVGLLGLQALGVYAARGLVRADYETKYTMAATDYMEQVVEILRRDTASSIVVSNLSRTEPYTIPGTNEVVSVRVAVSLDNTSISRRGVTVAVRRPAGPAARPDSVVLRTTVFIP